MTAIGKVELDKAWREHSRRVLSTLIRLLRDFDLAEEALHDAFLAAADRWPREGMPGNPSAWLVSAGRFRAIDRLRRRNRFNAAQDELIEHLSQQDDAMPTDQASIDDDQLRLIFTCCHPSLPIEAQVALTLREVCGLTTEEISRAFLVRTPTMAQRIVRAKARIKEAGLPYSVPERGDLPDRLAAVLQVIYLVFNEGYSASSGPDLVRAHISGEAIRLGRLLLHLLPDAEVMGLLGLMLLHESRRNARATDGGDIVLLADQDRRRWDRALIGEGTVLVDRAFATGQIGPYTLQGAIAATHANAQTSDATDWTEIAALYGVLLHAAPSDVVRLNRAVAIGMADSPEAGLRLIEDLIEDGSLSDYHLVYAAQADFLRRLHRPSEASVAYGKALQLCQLGPERRFLERRMAEIEGEGAAKAF